MLPHAFRVAGVSFLMMMALGHMPALFALPAGLGDILPAGLGDIAIGIEAPFIARRLARGTGHRAAIWFNVLGIMVRKARPPTHRRRRALPPIEPTSRGTAASLDDRRSPMWRWWSIAGCRRLGRGTRWSWRGCRVGEPVSAVGSRHGVVQMPQAGGLGSGQQHLLVLDVGDAGQASGAGTATAANPRCPNGPQPRPISHRSCMAGDRADDPPLTARLGCHSAASGCECQGRGRTFASAVTAVAIVWYPLSDNLLSLRRLTTFSANSVSLSHALLVSLSARASLASTSRFVSS